MDLIEKHKLQLSFLQKWRTQIEGEIAQMDEAEKKGTSIEQEIAELEVKKKVYQESGFTKVVNEIAQQIYDLNEKNRVSTAKKYEESKQGLETLITSIDSVIIKIIFALKSNGVILEGEE